MAAFALLASTHIVRSALLASNATGNGATATWLTHPKVVTAVAMREVALAAARGNEPSGATLARFKTVALSDPLAPESFLVEGALTMRRGDYARAEALLLHARTLEPRVPSARYLLADLYLKQDRPIEAMAEMSTLNRLVPAGSMGLVEAFSQYASKAGAALQVRSILAAYPELEAPVLARLAADARNTDLVLALHRSEVRGNPPPPWLPTLVMTLVQSGDYRRAFEVWRRLAGVAASPGAIFNPRFEANDAPPPFNWSLAKGSGAVVEAKAGSLDILYFGREDLTLAEQSLLLPPGRYRFAVQVTGSTAGNDIRWLADCLGSSGKLFELPIHASGQATRRMAEFSVPASCRAQRLLLTARGREFPERADIRIGGLQLANAGARQ